MVGLWARHIAIGRHHWVGVFRYDARVSCKATHAGVAGVGLSHVLVKRSTHVRFVSPAPCPSSPTGRGDALKRRKLRVRLTRGAPYPTPGVGLGTERYPVLTLCFRSKRGVSARLPAPYPEWDADYWVGWVRVNPTVCKTAVSLWRCKFLLDPPCRWCSSCTPPCEGAGPGA